MDEFHLELCSSTKEWSEREHYFVAFFMPKIHICESHDSIFVTQRRSSLVITTLCSFYVFPLALWTFDVSTETASTKTGFCPISPCASRISFLFFKVSFLWISHLQCRETCRHRT